MFIDGIDARMIRRASLTLLIAGSALLAGCLGNFSQPRVTPEHRQLKNRVAVVVLVDPQPRLNRVALQPTKSTHGRAQLAGWDVRAAIAPYLEKRMQGMALTVVPLTYDAADFAQVYASSQAYPNTALAHPTLQALGVAQNVDMVITVYRQAERDYVGESIENLVAYGVVQHEGGGTNTFACVRVEAYDVASEVVAGYADGCKSAPLPPETWQDSWASDDEVPIDAPAVNEALTAALQAAVLTAAQETGLSH